MRSALAVLAVLAAVASRGGCGEPDGGAGYDPCAGKACLEPCHLCPPDDAACFETMEVKVCNAAGRCVSDSGAFACPAADACAGKASGQPCVVALPCHAADPPCLAPVAVGHCDAAGTCVPGGAADADPCAGKACGSACDPCGGTCGRPYAMACDAAGQCVMGTPGACMP